MLASNVGDRRSGIWRVVQSGAPASDGVVSEVNVSSLQGAGGSDKIAVLSVNTQVPSRRASGRNLLLSFFLVVAAEAFVPPNTICTRREKKKRRERERGDIEV